MLLRHKKTQGEDQNWCVILSPIPSEIDRKKVAQKISGGFSLSLDEAFDLVSNTPIIILDNLTRDVAGKLKDYFRAAGAETILTNDVFQKRKCYRTVWPEPPNLSFLHNWAPVTAALKEDQQELHPEEALNEIRTLSGKEKASSQQPSLTSMPFMNRTDREQLAEEAERWRRECMKMRDEVKELKDQLEKSEKENRFQDFQPQEDPEWLDEKEKEIKEAQLLIEHANEKYEVLRQEYANARHLYEEKISALLQDVEAGKRKITELADNAQMTQRDRQAAQERLVQKEKEWQHLHEQELQAKQVLDQKIAKQLEEIARLGFQFKESQEKTLMFQRAKDELEQNVNSQAEQILHWREQHDKLSSKTAGMTQELHNEKTLREALEIRQRELEKNYTRMLQEQDEKVRLIQAWEVKFLETDRQLTQVKEAYEAQEKMLQQHIKLAETRERELDASRRQIRDLNGQIEQRETIQKRASLANQLVEKEGILKRLVQDQEKIESEIKAREESMRAILAQQESVEKEIIEAKQTQRHLAELAKREQKGRRPGSSHHEGTPLEETQND